MNKEKIPMAQDVPMEAPESTPFALTSITYMLYQGLSKRFGIGEEEREKNQNGLTLERCLDSDNPLVGFQGKIRFAAAFGRTQFELYSHIHHENPELEIDGGPEEDGVWAYGRGDLMVEKLSAKFRIIYGLNLQSPATLLISRIIEAAGELAKNPKCTCDQFWTAERHQ